MGKKANERNADAFRRKVRELLAANYSVAQIMKATGKSYVHVANIVAQEKAARATGEGEGHE